MEVEPSPLENADIMDEDTLDDLLQEDLESRPNQTTTKSLPSTATAKELRALRAPSSKRDLSTDTGDPQPLASRMKKGKVTGKGIAMLEKISNLFEENDNDRVGFIQVRLAAGKAKKTPARRPPKAKDNEKNLSYNACPADIEAKVRQCRAKEWQKWKEFNAGVILSKAELQELLDDGVKVNPMQWVETDKN